MFKKTLLFLFILIITACHQESSYRDLNGRLIHLSDFHSKWLIINYWATWCKPCSDEVPELNAFYDSETKKNAVILGVSYDSANLDTLKQWAKKLGIHYPVLTSDPAKELGLGDLAGLPTSIIIQPNGRIKKILYGPQTEKSLRDELVQ